jgi:hypothetical protein
MRRLLTAAQGKRGAPIRVEPSQQADYYEDIWEMDSVSCNTFKVFKCVDYLQSSKKRELPQFRWN